MRGTYRVYEDGKLIAEESNLITTAGKSIITQYLAGKIPSYAGAIAIGSGTTAAADSDTSLAMEYTRLPIYASYANIGASYKIVHKAVFPENTAGYITEMGLWPSLGNPVSSLTDQRMLVSSVTAGVVWTETVATVISAAGIASAAGGSTNIRIGTNSISFTANAAGTTPCNIDLSQYSPSDLIKVAFYAGSSSANSFTVRLEVDSSNYYSKSISHGSSTAYQINSSAISTWTATGAPTLGGIKTVRVTNGAGTVLYLDGIKVDPISTFNPVYNLVSRAVLGSPIVKRAGSRYDLEYEITVNY